jgi:hypothetical protein
VGATLSRLRCRRDQTHRLARATGLVELDLRDYNGISREDAAGSTQDD